jgi:hypothetical protein
MVDVQVRGPGGLSGNFGIGIAGVAFSTSGGDNGVQQA